MTKTKKKKKRFNNLKYIVIEKKNYSNEKFPVHFLGVLIFVMREYNERKTTL